MKRTTETTCRFYINEDTGALTVTVKEKIEVTYGGGREFWVTKEYSEHYEGQYSGVVISERRSYWGKSGRMIDEMCTNNLDVIV